MRQVVWVAVLASVFAWLITLLPSRIGEAMAEHQQTESIESANRYLEAEVKAGRIVKRASANGRVEYINPSLLNER